MSDEITRIVARAEQMLDANDDPQTAVSDSIADLLVFAHERGLDVAGAWYKGAAHYVATYLEFLSDDAAADWLQDNLFPFNGEDSADVYIGEDALILAGKDRRLMPEFGV